MIKKKIVLKKLRHGISRNVGMDFWMKIWKNEQRTFRRLSTEFRKTQSPKAWGAIAVALFADRHCANPDVVGLFFGASTGRWRNLQLGGWEHIFEKPKQNGVCF